MLRLRNGLITRRYSARHGTIPTIAQLPRLCIAHLQCHTVGVLPSAQPVAMLVASFILPHCTFSIRIVGAFTHPLTPPAPITAPALQWSNTILIHLLVLKFTPSNIMTATPLASRVGHAPLRPCHPRCHFGVPGFIQSCCSLSLKPPTQCSARSIHGEGWPGIHAFEAVTTMPYV